MNADELQAIRERAEKRLVEKYGDWQTSSELMNEVILLLAEVERLTKERDELQMAIESWKKEELVWRQSDHEHRIKQQQMQSGAEELLETVECLRGALGNLMARIFRDGGQKASAFADDVEAARAAEAEVVTLLARINFLHEGKEVAAEKLERLRGALQLAERVQNFWNAQAEWSREAFGPDDVRGPVGPLKHLAKEAKEAYEAEGKDPVEIADCLFLVFDAARRSGMTLETLIKVAEQKLMVNKSRQWPDWRTLPTTDAIEHKREQFCVGCEIELSDKNGSLMDGSLRGTPHTCGR